MQAIRKYGAGRPLIMTMVVLLALSAVYEIDAQPPTSFALSQQEQRESTQLTEVLCDELAGVVRFRVNNAYTVPLVSMRTQLQCKHPDSVNTLNLENLAIGLSNTFAIPPGAGELSGRDCDVVLEGWDPYSSTSPGQIITLDAVPVAGCGPIVDFRSNNRFAQDQPLCDPFDFICQVDQSEIGGSVWKGFFLLGVYIIFMVGIPSGRFLWYLREDHAYTIEFKGNAKKSREQQLALRHMFNADSPI